jgi:hypothetical protein
VGEGVAHRHLFSSDDAQHADGSARQNRRKQGGDVALTGFLGGRDIFFVLYKFGKYMTFTTIIS